MAVMRDRPYAQFNFIVDLGTGNTAGPEAGFQECSPISKTKAWKVAKVAERARPE